MRIHPDAEGFRLTVGVMASPKGYLCGAFEIPYKSYKLFAVVSDGSVDGWEHVSVSLKNRCPNWEEMCYVRSLFWDEEDTVIQFHVPKSQHINNHPYCLHLWRKKDAVVELPPSIAVGVKT
jgi:hypothetical protein